MSPPEAQHQPSAAWTLIAVLGVLAVCGVMLFWLLG